MTRKEYAKLTDVEKQIKVAELANWERGPKKRISLGAFGYVMPMTCWHRKNEEACWRDNPPDYLNDLNAMHEAVTGLPFELKVKWARQMWNICRTSKSQYPTYFGDFQAMSATAAQQAEAFVLTMTANILDKP